MSTENPEYPENKFSAGIFCYRFKVGDAGISIQPTW